MYDRLTKIDDLSRPDHYFIEPEDEIYYFGEYTARGGYGASQTNRLIINLKKAMNLQGTNQWWHKTQAINEFAADVRRIVGSSLGDATLIPVPCSRIRTDPMYDDRLRRILDAATVGLNADIREPVYLTKNLPQSRDGDRVAIEELVDAYAVDLAQTAPIRNNMIVIFDDMLTTGRHFRATKRLLESTFPAFRTVGLFLTRRAITATLPP